jgi:hypothetical protein
MTIIICTLIATPAVAYYLALRKQVAAAEEAVAFWRER